jgi:hypothetical protein
VCQQVQALLENGIEDEIVSAVDRTDTLCCVAAFEITPQFLSVIEPTSNCQVSWMHFGAEGLPLNRLRQSLVDWQFLDGEFDPGSG